jgi:radical SAM protein with 4Fe4S-binding SPASM domain
MENFQPIFDFFQGLRLKFINQEIPRSIPSLIQIESTNKCNLRCPTCSHSRESSSGQHLSVGELQKILDRLPFPLEHVVLSGIGEPLLNPDFFFLIDLLNERKITCVFYSNGTLLTPQRCDAILLRHNIKGLTISCDGANKKTFENIRLGANFENWKQSVRHFLIKAKHERPDLRIGMLTVMNKQNLNELGDIIRLAADLGFHTVQFLDPIPVDDVAAINVPSKNEFSAIHYDELFDLGRSCGLRYVYWWGRRDKLPPKAIPRCLQPWNYIFIRVNGDIQPCCAIFGTKKAAIMGNIFHEEFINIWNGEHFNKFRRTSVKGTNSLCNVCPYY